MTMPDEVELFEAKLRVVTDELPEGYDIFTIVLGPPDEDGCRSFYMSGTVDSDEALNVVLLLAEADEVVAQKLVVQ